MGHEKPVTPLNQWQGSCWDGYLLAIPVLPTLTIFFVMGKDKK
jgi:hypothetical protein